MNSVILWDRGQLRLDEYKSRLRSLRERVGTDSRSDYLRCLACGLTPRVRLRERDWNRGESRRGAAAVLVFTRNRHPSLGVRFRHSQGITAPPTCVCRGGVWQYTCRRFSPGIKQRKQAGGLFRSHLVHDHGLPARAVFGHRKCAPLRYLVAPTKFSAQRRLKRLAELPLMPR